MNSSVFCALRRIHLLAGMCLLLLSFFRVEAQNQSYSLIGQYTSGIGSGWTHDFSVTAVVQGESRMW